MPSSAGSRRHRLLFVNYTTERTGPSNSLLHLVKHLREEHDVTVLLPGTGPLNDALEGLVRVVTLPNLNAGAIPAIARVVRRERADLVYANNTHGSSRNACIAARLARRPFVCHVRGMGWNKDWRRLGYLRFADAVIAVSQSCAESVRRFPRPGALHVVYNGVSLNGTRPVDVALVGRSVRRLLCEELGITGDTRLFLSVAHVCGRKGQLHSVESIAHIAKAFPGTHLLLVGSLTRDAAYVERLRARASELGVADRVHMLGFRADVERLYYAADLFLHTAIADPQPRAVIEAMAARLPVVAFAVDGVAETVVDGETGLLVPSRDVPALAQALTTLLGDADRRSRMGEAGHARVREHFSAERTAVEIDGILRSVLARRKPRRA